MNISAKKGEGVRALATFCDAVDRLNRIVGVGVGMSVIFVTAAVVWEVFARGVLGRPTIWSNETTIYLSAVTYLIAGGYALLNNQHVRIDLIYANLNERTQARLDAITLIFTLVYAFALIWFGGKDFWGSFAINETTGTPWNPPIWPVKAAIPIAGFLVALQAISNTLRQLGLAPAREIS
jgi:TRAP-type mannitol/chloroaromatic compound transport system permease small subunit